MGRRVPAGGHHHDCALVTPLAAPGSCRGLYQTLGQPAVRHDTRRCPAPWASTALAGPQSQGIQLTITRPGPHGWP